MGDCQTEPLRPRFDRRLRLEFHGANVTSDAGLLAYRELDDALQLTDSAADVLHDTRTGRNTRHGLAALLRQSLFSRLAGYEDLNDAQRLRVDPAMRTVVGGRARDKTAASTSEIGRFETETLTTRENLNRLMDLSGRWIDRAHRHRKLTRIVLDMDSSVSETYGQQQGSAYNGHFGCTCYHPLFVFNQFGDLERVMLRRGNQHSAKFWRRVLLPVIARYRELKIPKFFRGDAAFASPKLFRVLEAGGLLVRDPTQGQRRAGATDRPPDEATGGPPLEEAEGLLPQLPLPGEVVGSLAAGGGQDRMARGRVVPPGRVRGDQPEAQPEAGGQVLQRPRHGGAVDQGGEERGEVDAAVVPPVQGQPGAAAAVRPGLQPGELPAAAGAAPVGADWTLTTLREKLIKIGAKVVRHAKAVTFQLAEVAVPRALFAAILGRIGRLRAAPSPG